LGLYVYTCNTHWFKGQEQMMSHFYPRDVVSAVYATATWLAGCPSHTGIVSKRL